MSYIGKAFYIKDVPNSSGWAKLFRIEHPPLPPAEAGALDDRDVFGESLPPYVVVSTTNLGWFIRSDHPIETLVVEATPEGKVVDWAEAYGQRDEELPKDFFELHKQVLGAAGYEMIRGETPCTDPKTHPTKLAGPKDQPKS